MADVFSVSAVLSPTNPTTGQTITLTAAGSDVLTTTTQSTIGPLTLSFKAADGATTTITVPSAAYTQVTTTPESVTLTGVSDPSGRIWTILPGGLTATAIA